MISSPGESPRSTSLDVFISYKHGPDTVVARELARRLREAGFVVFFDEDIRTGQVLLDAIDEAIYSSKVVLLLWSHSARARSTNVAGELDVAKEVGSLMPVALDDAPLSTFFRALKVSRLMVDGKIDERAFSDLRRDIGERCGRMSLANPAPIPRRPFSSAASMVARSNRPPHRPAIVRLPSGRTQVHVPSQARKTRSRPYVPAILRAVELVDRRGVWLREEAPADVVAIAREFAHSRPSTALAYVDLSLPGITRIVLILFADHLELCSSSGVVSVEYEEILRRRIELQPAGYGFTATIAIENAAELTVRGRQQATLLLEVLHDLREELSWVN